jgi:hypothetical protein
MPKTPDRPEHTETPFDFSLPLQGLAASIDEAQSRLIDDVAALSGFIALLEKAQDLGHLDGIMLANLIQPNVNDLSAVWDELRAAASNISEIINPP